MATLERLRSLSGTELRFRLTSELRKHRDRLRAALRPLRWSRRHLLGSLARTPDNPAPLRSALAAGDWGGAHHALVTRLTTRPPRFPLDPRALPGLAAEIAARFPEARARAAARANRMLDGHYDVLGYRNVRYGSPPDWHGDPVHGRRPPMAFWSQVPYLDPAFGDHKVIWEINRHQHWLGLARAWHLTGDRRYYDAFVSQLQNWMATNPPLGGVNWSSMLELGFRSLSWVWALHFFSSAALDDAPEASPWSVDLLIGLDRQLTHIEENLSRYFSPNTHLTGEALALYVAGAALPELAASARRVTLGRQILLAEIDRQINTDGGHAELSAHYHRYSTDFYLLATQVARASADPAAPLFEAAARRQARYLRAMADARGRIPLLGDDDGGLLFPICGRKPADCTDTLSSAAVILDDASLAPWASPEETWWCCGHGAADTAATEPASCAFPESGYYVSRTPNGDHLIVDAGRLGFLNGGHAHADALGIIATVGSRPLLVDAGTATYTMDAATRDRFRSTALHNTVVVGGRSQSEPRGPFHWASRADATCLVWHTERRFDYVEGVHHGYHPTSHVRGVFALHGLGWVVLDHLLGPDGARVEADILWHVHPDWQLEPDGHSRFRHRDGTTVAMASSARLTALTHEESAGLDGYAPAYGLELTTTALRDRATLTTPDTVATCIALNGLAGPLAIERVAVTVSPGPHWHAAAFRLSWGAGDALVLSAVERTPETLSNAAPPAPWGTASVLTTGRVAVMPLNAGFSPFIVPGPGPAPAGAGRA